MSGRATLRALAVTMREVVFGSRRAGGDGARRGGHSGTEAQIAVRPPRRGEGGGGVGFDSAYRGGGAHGGGAAKGAYRGGGAYGGGGAHGGGAAKGAYGGGSGTHGGGSGAGAIGDAGKGRNGGRRRRRARGKGQKRNDDWWGVLMSRMKMLFSDRDWTRDMDTIEGHVERAERVRHLSGRIYALGRWAFEGCAAAGTAVTLVYINLAEKAQVGATVVKDKVLVIKDAVKEKLSPSKARPPKVPVDAEELPMSPHALDFSP